MTLGRVVVTGGAGYVGSALVPRLSALGYPVKVIDLFLYGEAGLEGLPVEKVRGDLRDEPMLLRELRGADAVVHLACVSNDPSFELDPELGKSINFDAFLGLLRAARENGVRRFIYASSSSVYGIREEPEVREDSPCAPLTDYSKYKLLCERALADFDLGGEWVIARPSTVCGPAPRMRFDLVVNLLAAHALERKEITVFGGSQLRPNLHIDDMVEAYRVLLEAPGPQVDRAIFNIGHENCPVRELAERVRAALGDPSIAIVTKETRDLRSYHVNSDRIREVLGFGARRSIEEAVRGIAQAYRAGRYDAPLTNPLYHNIHRMRQLKLGGKAVERP